MNAPKAAPRSHQVLTPEMACSELSFCEPCFMAIRGEKVTITALKVKASNIPVIGKPNEIRKIPRKQKSTEKLNILIGEILSDKKPLKTEMMNTNNFFTNK